jgi:hypothetical protein
VPPGGILHLSAYSPPGYAAPDSMAIFANHDYGAGGLVPHGAMSDAIALNGSAPLLQPLPQQVLQQVLAAPSCPRPFALFSSNRRGGGCVCVGGCAGCAAVLTADYGGRRSVRGLLHGT